MLCLIFSNSVVAQSEKEDLALIYGDQPLITIATGSKQTVSRAPAVATVITQQDIEAMGASDLDQVLRRVPGLHVSVKSQAYNPIYSFRGIFTDYNPQVLMLVNGLPITNVFQGDRSQIWGGMPVVNIARIEVIRGPGSALYGADAYAGVINIVTKTADDIQGTQFGVRAGSFKSKDAWVLHGGEFGEHKLATYFAVSRTDGDKQAIERDAFGRSGFTSNARDSLDVRTDLEWNSNWRWRFAYQQREIGVATGLGPGLDPQVGVPVSRLYTDLSYNEANWAPNWDVSANLSYYDIQEKSADPYFTLIPAPFFPGGMLGNPSHSERHTHLGASAFYTGLQSHRIRLGLGYRIEDMYKVNELKNFDKDFNPLGNYIDASNDPSLVFAQPHKRRLAYIFAQDEWDFAKDWTLTAGIRHDRYSDFGGTTNPRLALVWNAAYNVVIKALHGRAFRAPSFAELYNINNPVAQGNPNLKPETIVTNELALAWQPTPSLQTNFSLFRYKMSDIIRYAPVVAQNTGSQVGHGVELEANWAVNRDLKLTGNFSWQRSKDLSTASDAGLAPHRRLFLQTDWRFKPSWQLGTTINYVMDRERQFGDNRPAPSDYFTVDATLSKQQIFGNWSLRATIQNLFDVDAREPSFYSNITPPSAIPFDLPLPGRAFYVQLQHDL